MAALPEKYKISSSMYLYILFTLIRTSCSNFGYSAAPNPSQSTENVDIKTSLSPTTEILFIASATNCIMNFANL